MRAGPLDRRIEIQERTPVPDTIGQRVDSWATIATVWAQRRTAGRGEAFTAAQRLASATDEFRIRYRTDFTPSPSQHRILFDGNAYDILSVAELGRREGWSLVCEVVNL